MEKVKAIFIVAAGFNKQKAPLRAGVGLIIKRR